MGKTTNLLMKAGQDAFHGNVDLRAVRTLYESTLREFHLQGTHTETEVTQILDDCQRLLQGIALLEELSPCSLDHLVSTGERCAVRIVAARLNQIGVPAEAYDAWQVGMFTDDHHQNAGLVRNYKENIGKAFQRIDANVVAVVTGFLGMDRTTGKITTLGRGGSDLTATAIGAGLNVGT
jgi:aspartate kinase